MEDRAHGGETGGRPEAPPPPLASLRIIAPFSARAQGLRHTPDEVREACETNPFVVRA